MIVEIDPTEPEPWLVSRAAEALRRGGVAMIPTDTVYGLACGISQTKAIKRVYELKQMDADVRKRVNDAAEFATYDPEPDRSELYTDVLR